MTNKEKAEELYQKWCNSETEGCVGDLLLEMAEWKDKHPSVDTIKKIVCYALKYTNIVCGLDNLENDVEWERLIKKAMKFEIDLK